MINIKKNRLYNLYVIYFRKNGEKREVVLNSQREVFKKKQQLEKNKRKFLGYRQITLKEVPNAQKIVTSRQSS